MDKSASQKNILLFLAAIVAFVIFSCIFFMPVIQGKMLLQSDVLNYIGANKETQDYYEKTGEAALWTNSMFGGMPTYQVTMYESGNLFEKLFKATGLFLPRPISFMFISLLSFFVLLRSFRVNYFLSISGALCYALGTYLITFIEAGHNTKVNALALMPFVLTGVNYLLRNKFWLGATLVLFGMCMEITANHPQINYYMFLLIACWMISELVVAVRKKEYKPFFRTVAILIACTLLAVTANTSRLWTTYEYSKETIRGGSELTKNKATQSTGLDREYAFGWSSGLAESFSIMYPDFSGGGTSRSFVETTDDGQLSPDASSEALKYLQSISQQDGKKAQELYQVSHGLTKYWGDMPFTSGPIYVGSILCFLFIIGCFLAKNRMRWWLIAGTLLSLFLGVGKNFPAFNYFMFDYFPLYNKFRTVSMAMVILCLTIPFMAYYISDRFLSNSIKYTDKQKFDALKWSSIIVGGLSLLLLMPSALFDLLSPSETMYLARANDSQTTAFFDLLKDERAALIRSDVLKSMLFMGLVAGTLWLFLKKRINLKLAVAVICILPVMDLLITDSHYLSKKNYVEKDYYETHFRQSTPVIKDNDPYYRVYNTLPDLDKDGSTSYSYKSIGGYHGAKLQRYQDMLEYLTTGNMGAISMLNTKYFISSRNNKFAVDRNPMACGNAWFVDTIRMVKNADEEFESLKEFDPRHIAFVHEEFKAQIPSLTVAHDSSATITLIKYDPNELTYKSSSQHAAPAIFSEIWYRGNEDWKAYIDGNYVDHFRANYILRGLWIPAGEHEITFKFEPHSYYAGKKISTASSSILIVLLCLGLFMSVKGSFKKQAETEAPKK